MLTFSNCERLLLLFKLVLSLRILTLKADVLLESKSELAKQKNLRHKAFEKIDERERHDFACDCQKYILKRLEYVLTESESRIFLKYILNFSLFSNVRERSKF